jgi:hypothetical protein
MHASTTCKIIFSASEERLEKVADYLEKIQRGEYFFDEETENLICSIEEDFELTNKEEIISFIERLYRAFKKKVDIHVIGVMNAIGSDSSMKFECQYNSNYFRYRETDWSDYEIDTDLSVEEFEEENYIDVDDDEYEEYVHRAHDGFGHGDDEIYGDWEYLD